MAKEKETGGWRTTDDISDRRWVGRHVTASGVSQVIAAMLICCLAADGLWAQTISPRNDPIEVPVAIVFRGDLAPRNLAITYEFLDKYYPALLYGNEGPITVDPKEKVPWKAALEIGVWPNDAAQDKLFETTFKKGILYAFPRATAKTILVTDLRWQWPRNWSRTEEPSEADKRRYCSQFNFTEAVRQTLKGRSPNAVDIEALVDDYVTHLRNGSCIIGTRRPVASLSNQNAFAGQLALRVPGLMLTTYGRLERDSVVSLRERLTGYIRDWPVLDSSRASEKFAVWNVTVVPVGPPEEVKRNQHAQAPLCKGDEDAVVRSLVTWPATVPDLQGRSPYLVVLDDKVNGLITRDDAPASSAAALFPQYLNPSISAAKRAHCITSASRDSTARTYGHAVAVATAAYGHSLDLDLGNGRFVKTSPLMKPANLCYTRTEFLLISGADPLFDQLCVPDQKRFVLAASLGRLLPLISDVDWAKNINSANLVASKGVLIVAAPERQRSGENFPLYSYRRALSALDVASCDRWPACLGATPFALTVAPLARDNSLYKQESYVLGSAVVALAAPGEDVLTLADETSADITLVPRSGSSFAVAVVAAGAMLVSATEVGSMLEPGKIAARLSATADLVSGDEAKKIRFGRLNMRRAVCGLDRREPGASDVVWKLNPFNVQALAEGHPECGEVTSVEAHAKTVQLVVPPGTSEEEIRRHDAVSKGYLRAFFPDGTSLPIPVRQLLRIRPSGTSDNKSNQPFFDIVYFWMSDGLIRNPATDEVAMIVSDSAKQEIKLPQYYMPIILREVRLAHPNNQRTRVEGCDWTGDSLKESTSFKYACLYRKSENGAMPIDLREVDIVFGAERLQEERRWIPALAAVR